MSNGQSASAWQGVTALSGLLAAVFVPVALGYAGNQVSTAIKEREIQAHFVELAVGILRDPPHGDVRDSLRSWATLVVSQYSGVKMSAQVQQLLRVSAPLPGGRGERAATLETAAVNHLLAGDADSATVLFQAAEDAYPTYHQAYEIARLLRSQRHNLTTPSGRRSVLDSIATHYNYGLTMEQLSQLRAAARP